MQIGNLNLEPGAVLAPMAGFTDAACRRLAAKHGAIYTITEMVSAKALTFGDKKSAQLMYNGQNDAPYGIQLFGADPETMGQAAALIAQQPYDLLDINMGCPAPKIVSSGAGSKLMLDPDLCGRIVEAVVSQTGGRPVTVKMRAGWDENSRTAEQVAIACEQAGAALVGVHGRTREQMYQPNTVSLEAIARVKQAVKIPVLGNGDIASAEDALVMVRQTGCDCVMVGRAALGDPWLFGEIRAALNGRPLPEKPTLRQRLEALRTQVYEMCEEKGEWVAMAQARSQALHYMRGLKGATTLRRACCQLSHYQDLDDLFDLVYQEGNR